MRSSTRPPAAWPGPSLPSESRQSRQAAGPPASSRAPARAPSWLGPPPPDSPCPCPSTVGGLAAGHERGAGGGLVPAGRRDAPREPAPRRGALALEVEAQHLRPVAEPLAPPRPRRRTCARIRDHEGRHAGELVTALLRPGRRAADARPRARAGAATGPSGRRRPARRRTSSESGTVRSVTASSGSPTTSETVKLSDLAAAGSRQAPALEAREVLAHVVDGDDVGAAGRAAAGWSRSCRRA